MTSVLDRAVNAKLADLWVEQLVAKRYELSLTRQQVGDRIGVGKTLIRNWERRLHHPCVANLMSWAEVLGHELQMVPAAPQAQASLRDLIVPVLDRAAGEGGDVVAIAAVEQAIAVWEAGQRTSNQPQGATCNT